MHPKVVLIKETILKEYRLSDNNRIRRTLPEEIASFIPEDRPKGSYKYGSDDQALYTLSKEAIQVLKTQQTNTELETILSKVREHEIPENSDFDSVCVHFLVQSILHVGGDTMSHSFALLDRLSPFISENTSLSSSSSKVAVVDAIMQYWNQAPSIGIRYVERLIRNSVITSNDVFQWLFFEANPEFVFQSQGWQLTDVIIYLEKENIGNTNGISNEGDSTDAGDMLKERINGYKTLVTKIRNLYNEDEITNMHLSWARQWFMCVLRRAHPSYLPVRMWFASSNEEVQAFLEDLPQKVTSNLGVVSFKCIL